MIIKKGTVTKIINEPTGETVTTTVDIIEKVEGGYTEVLGRKNYEVTLNETVLTGEYNDSFEVFYGKTIGEILQKYGVYGEYTWTSPLMQVF